MLLAEGGEDEIRIRDGQEIALRLAAPLRTLAPDAARSDGDQRLANLIPAAARVGIRET